MEAVIPGDAHPGDAKPGDASNADGRDGAKGVAQSAAEAEIALRALEAELNRLEAAGGAPSPHLLASAMAIAEASLDRVAALDAEARASLRARAARRPGIDDIRAAGDRLDRLIAEMRDG